MSPVPEGLWDCHAHVIEDRVRYPLSQGRDYEPPTATLDHYLAMLDRQGLDHGVLVQPSVYGFDNRCLLDGLDRSDGRLFGVAVPAPEARPHELEAMHRRGVRGVRCNVVNSGGLQPETVLDWQPVLRELGWHVAFHIAVETIPDLRRYLERFDVPVIIDHMGLPRPGRVDVSAPGLRQLVDLVRAGGCYVKLSAPYRLSNEPPPWRDVTPLARALLEANPSACLWATDWPHTQHHTAVSEDDLIAALSDWCPDQESRQSMMSTAPRVLYD